MPLPKGMGVRSLGGFRLDWKGDRVVKQVRSNVAEAWGEVGLRVETEAKRQLYKGHGVVTGTLRRSIHTAQPGYNWRGDDVTPAPNSPERGGQLTLGLIQSDGIVTQVGSGLVYALAIHQGIGSFDGYHYLRNALRIVKPQILAVLKKHGVGLKR